MGKQRAGRIEFAAVDDDMVAGVGESGLEIGGALGAEFGKGVAETHAFQRFGKQQLLLLRVGHGADGGDDAEMVLRDLADRGIGGRDDLDHLGQRDVGHFRPAECLRAH